MEVGRRVREGGLGGVQKWWVHRGHHPRLFARLICRGSGPRCLLYTVKVTQGLTARMERGRKGGCPTLPTTPTTPPTRCHPSLYLLPLQNNKSPPTPESPWFRLVPPKPPAVCPAPPLLFSLSSPSYQVSLGNYCNGLAGMGGGEGVVKGQVA